MFFAMGQTVLFALAGPVVREIGLEEWQFGVVISASAIVFMLVSPIWGRLSDRWGRKAVIVCGLAGYGAMTLLFAGVLQAGLAGLVVGVAAFAALTGARVLYAVVSGGIQPASAALMADMTTSGDRSAGMALIGAAFGIGSVLGPAFAALLVGFGVLLPLIIIAAAAIVSAALILILVKAPQAQVASESTVPPLAAPSIAPLIPYLALMFGTYVAVSALQQTAGFFIQDFTGADVLRAAQLAGFAFMALAAGTLAVQGGIVQVFKPSPRIMLLTGFPVTVAGIAGYALAPDFLNVVASFAVMGGGFGLLQPGISAAASLVTSGDRQGETAGFIQGAMAAGFVVGPVAGTLIYNLDVRAPLAFAGGCLVICYFVVLTMRR
jgi:MFS family permease